MSERIHENEPEVSELAAEPLEIVDEPSQYLRRRGPAHNSVDPQQERRLVAIMAAPIIIRAVPSGD